LRWRLEGVLFTVSSLLAAACWRLQAITLAALLAVKMAEPIDFKMQNGYYFYCPRRTRRTDDE